MSQLAYFEGGPKDNNARFFKEGDCFTFHEANTTHHYKRTDRTKVIDEAGHVAEVFEYETSTADNN